MKVQLVVIASVLTMFVSGGFVLASEKGHHEGGHEPAGGAVEKSHMPETVPGIWHEVKDHAKHLDETIQAGKLDKVHEVAFKIRDQVNALAEKSTSLAPENLENVKAGSGRVAEIANLLDKYGDAGDKAKTEEQFQRLTKALGYIESQYSPDILGKEDAHSEAGPAHHEE